MHIPAVQEHKLLVFILHNILYCTPLLYAYIHVHVVGQMSRARRVMNEISTARERAERPIPVAPAAAAAAASDKC
jgi:hypothetical protein